MAGLPEMAELVATAEPQTTSSRGKIQERVMVTQATHASEVPMRPRPNGDGRPGRGQVPSARGGFRVSGGVSLRRLR
ncbi:hypothetical protein GCM10010302_09970 [Streptomyces polychromogenes]|uniref:Uncharacterized protein n=1 Tax=Streptomyces polychromogenes TaxID=67342 RepID=A0ABN0V425_9ACTN